RAAVLPAGAGGWTPRAFHVPARGARPGQPDPPGGPRRLPCAHAPSGAAADRIPVPASGRGSTTGQPGGQGPSGHPGPAPDRAGARQSAATAAAPVPAGTHRHGPGRPAPEPGTRGINGRTTAEPCRTAADG